MLLDKHKDKWEPVTETGCFIWTGANNKGYGVLQFSSPRKLARVSRLILEEKLQRPIAEGMTASHTCHTPCCVNPDHIVEEDLKTNFDRMPLERKAKQTASGLKVGRTGLGGQVKVLRARGFFHKAMKKWTSSRTIQGKKVFLGYFDTQEEATQAYLLAVDKV